MERGDQSFGPVDPRFVKDQLLHRVALHVQDPWKSDAKLFEDLFVLLDQDKGLVGVDEFLNDVAACGTSATDDEMILDECEFFLHFAKLK
ncbi:MAG TPA: hypothetical protein DCE42_26380 [Myxococcales bacterium]|nr:hypothetical protein [Myxococcales bacterium]